MDQNTKDILETVNFIKDRMLTKDDVRDITRAVIRREVPAMIREELKPLHHETPGDQQAPRCTRRAIQNLKGVTKEIDELRAQVREIEKHLRLNKKIAA